MNIMHPETMTAAVYHGPHDIRIENVPVPAIGADEVLVKVVSASICGTDLRIYKGAHRQYPEGTIRIPGHEVVGDVAAIGAQIQDYEVGQRVFIAPNIGRSASRETVSGHNNMDPHMTAIGVTIDGAFAEYMRIPAEAVRQGNLMPISKDLDPAVVALVEPFACVLRGQDAIRVGESDVVVVMGAGPIGLMHVLLARLRGARRIIVSEPSAMRRQQALQMGADRALDPTTDDLHGIVMEETNERGADAIITAAPSKAAQESTLGIAARWGRINFFGGLPRQDSSIRIDANIVHYKELTLTGTTACSTYDCLRAKEIIDSGRVDLSPIISKIFPLTEAPAAFEAAQDLTMLKIALKP